MDKNKLVAFLSAWFENPVNDIPVGLANFAKCTGLPGRAYIEGHWDLDRLADDLIDYIENEALDAVLGGC